MGESRYQKLLFVILFKPSGIIAFFSILLGFLGISLYTLMIAYNPSLFFEIRPWFIPILLLSIGAIFLYLSIKSIESDSQKFVKDIKEEKKRIERIIESLENSDMEKSPLPDSSEVGINDLDIEIIELVKENGGFIPILKKDIDESSISYKQAVKSLAKLEVMGYLRISQEGKNRGEKKIIITVKGLELLEMPRVTFITVIPEDITLMLVHANILYRKGEFETSIGKCYNTIERALKTHLIPSIDDYIEKWNKKHSDRKWKGNKTMVSLNSLFNFYRENVNMDKNVAKFVKNAIDYIAEVRSRYSHDKPSEKYQKDAYRVLKLTELILGMMFENLKEQVGLKSEKIANL